MFIEEPRLKVTKITTVAPEAPYNKTGNEETKEHSPSKFVITTALALVALSFTLKLPERKDESDEQET